MLTFTVLNKKGKMMKEYSIKDYFSMDGAGGFMVLTVGLVVAAAILWTLALSIQQEQADNYYSIDTNINAVKADDIDQNRHYKSKH